MEKNQQHYLIFFIKLENERMYFNVTSIECRSINVCLRVQGNEREEERERNTTIIHKL